MNVKFNKQCKITVNAFRETVLAEQPRWLSHIVTRLWAGRPEFDSRQG